METVNQFNYLGLLLNYNGKFFQTQKHRAQQGRKAMFSLMSNLRKFKFNIRTQCAVFDTYVNSILSYGAEVWGFHKGPDIEKVHTCFCKNVLGVKKNTCNDFIYCELGRLPLTLSRQLKIIKYWLKVKNTENIILSTCYEEMVKYNTEWISNIKLLLDQLGLSYLWNIATKRDYCIIEQRFLDVQKQIILSNIQHSSKAVLYKYLIDNCALQSYLQKPIEYFYIKQITRMRLCSHNLNIERGRYSNIERHNRICTFCNLNEIEDEYHFILKCPLYNDIRSKYIKQYYFKKACVFKLVQLFSTDNVKDLRNLGKYILFSHKRRAELLM